MTEVETLNRLAAEKQETYDAVIANLEAEVETSKRLATEKGDAYAAAMTEANLAKQATTSLGEQLSVKELVVSARERELSKLRKSLTWKLTSPLRAPLEFVRKRQQKADLALIRASGLFDESWYLEQYPDVKESKVDPALHYLRYGAYEGRWASEYFDSGSYLLNYRDVLEAGLNPLMHFLRYGEKEGRKGVWTETHGSSALESNTDTSDAMAMAKDQAPRSDMLDERSTALAAETARAHEQQVARETAAARLREFESKLPSSEQEISQIRQQLDRAAPELYETHNAYRNSKSRKLSPPIRAGRAGPRSSIKAISISPNVFRLGGGVLPTLAKATRILLKEGPGAVRKRMDFVKVFSHQSAEFRRVAAPASSSVLIKKIHPNLRFTEHIKPELSIIIPVYNNLNYTLECLSSLMQQSTSLSYEVIVMDDCSTDETAQVLSTIPGLRYICNETNLGFLRNCNKAADLSLGRYLVLLNNDTKVLPGWLDTLYATFTNHEDVGIAGSKLVYPDGRLQEAGGIIWNDATGWNWGRLQDPNHPRYNYVRDVDYVSGASLMISKELFNAVGRLDERYIPAYAEDADLCMAVRDRGLRVVYQPHSVVIHFEGISHGTDESVGIKAYQRANKDKFEAKWRETLHSRHYPSGQTPLRAADRMSQRHLLFIDHITPETDKDAGSVEVMHIISIFQKLGYRVHFVPETNFANIPKYTPNIQSKGIEAIYGPYYRSVGDYLEEWGELIDTAVIFRVGTAERNIATVRRLAPNARVIFHPADLHYLRAEREALVKNDAELKALAGELKKLELSMVAAADMTYVVSEFEQQLLAKDAPSKKVVVIPMIRDKSHRACGYQGRVGAAFIGGYRHTPNVGAAEFLIREIWPIVRAANIGARLKIIGSNMPDHFHSYAASDIDIIGYVEDIEKTLGEMLMTVAPLPYGAGTKGKVGTSMNLGVPCIGNDIAFEGMPSRGLYDAVVLANTTQQFAEEIIRLHIDPIRWEQLSQSCMSYVDEHFSLTKVQGIIKDSIKFDQA